LITSLPVARGILDDGLTEIPEGISHDGNEDLGIMAVRKGVRDPVCVSDCYGNLGTGG